MVGWPGGISLKNNLRVPGVLAEHRVREVALEQGFSGFPSPMRCVDVSSVLLKDYRSW